MVLLNVGIVVAIIASLLVWFQPSDPILPNVTTGEHLLFKRDFLFGTATAAAQIETASAHNWRGLVARDGVVFNRTVEHEKHREEDAEFIVRLGNAYRFSMDWARLQPAPFAPFDEEVVKEYLEFISVLRAKGGGDKFHLMLVLHHFTEPLWFSGWTAAQSVDEYLNFVERSVAVFGAHIDSWNTFNEPNVYLMNGFLLGVFPPLRLGALTSFRTALINMQEAHVRACNHIKTQWPQKPIGISLNTALFVGEDLVGRYAAALFDYVFHHYVGEGFREGTDFLGLSYYAKIRIGIWTGGILTEIDRPGEMDKRGIAHDQMWELEPRGLAYNIMRLADKKRPVIITEYGISTKNCSAREKLIRDTFDNLSWVMKHGGVRVIGAFHWSVLDNMEWNLGLTQTFGLVHVDSNPHTGTMKRTMKQSGEYLARFVEKATAEEK